MAGIRHPSHNRSLPGQLRIVAGKWRSRLLQIIDEPELRPTPVRIRETLFNWLSPVTEGARCLDLFAGTGALGIEALSRGAAQVVFIEQSVTLVEAIRKNLIKLEAVNAQVYQRDALDYLCKEDPQPFDIVFLDPPFDTDLIADVCKLLRNNNWLANSAIIYLEQGKDNVKPVLVDEWVITHEKITGKVSYSLMKTGTLT
jgi:16S rRNA (guanine966-N2)-methyltransferase